jgi:6-phosphogluconolactonase
MTTPVVTAWTDAGSLAEGVAARLVTRLVTAQADRAAAGVVLTGGQVGIAVLAALAGSPARDSVDWSRLDVWWGDERFVPADDAARNEGQARRALLDHVPVDPRRVHPMPAVGSVAAGPGGDDVHAAAAAYAAELAAHADVESHGPLPRIDVLLLGVGPDGHVASLFPHAPALYDSRPVVGVVGAPKPPRQRISLTLPAIRTADEVWLVAAGEDKAGAVRLALGDAGEVAVPASGARGRIRTRWMLDRAAARLLPSGLARPASP